MTALTKQRNSAMEILRIISILLIICCHFTTHGVQFPWTAQLSLTGFTMTFSRLGNMGIAIFVMLSGYFSINTKFQFKKAFGLIFQVQFYSILLCIISILIGAQQFNLEYAISSLFPATTQLYWFFTTFLVLYFLSPFINKLINVLSQKQHLTLVGIAVVFWSIMPTFTGNNFYASSVTDFLMYYLIGAFLQKYPENLLSKKNNSKIIAAITFALLLILTIALLKSNDYKSGLGIYAMHIYNRTSIFIVLIAACLVDIFSKIKPFTSKIINTAAGCCFGVYLIHDNRAFRYFMWLNIFKSNEYGDEPYAFFYILLSALIIFAACSVIELARKQFVEKPVMKLYDLIEEKIKLKLNK